jgi:hypothetical protein
MQPYHMTKKEREITDPQVMADILRKGKFTVLVFAGTTNPMWSR